LTSADVSTREPWLIVRKRPAFWTARLRRWFFPPAGAALIGLAGLLMSGNVLVPFTPVVTLHGRTGSKGEIFQDARMQRLLMEHHLKVSVARTGSRDLATSSFDGYDFLFPSGRPAAEMIGARLGKTTQRRQTSKPFVSPLVLATFRQYAETLVEAGVATRQGDSGAPLYYTLATDKFLKLVATGKTWNELGLSRRKDAHGKPLSNGNRVLAHSPSPCDSNSGEAFVALTAFALNGRNAPPGPDDVKDVAAGIKPLLNAQGMHDADLFASYTTPEGKGKAPVVVIYEHQFFSYQIHQHESTGAPDSDRVLLYPEQEMLTDPEFIPLDDAAERLRQLLDEDTAIRRRAMELGYRVVDSTSKTDSDQLWAYLKEFGIPEPDRGGNLTKAETPVLADLEQLITMVGGCR
jgi:hypothetical protein